MREMKDFDISEYVRDGVVYLENLHVENCRFAALQSEWDKKKVIIKKSTFSNVVFDNCCGRGFIDINGSEFINCNFQGKLGNGLFSVWNSAFRECTFMDFSIEGVQVSELAKSSLFDCTFHNIDLRWSISLYKIEAKGGKIENSRIVKASIVESRFSDMQMEHLELGGSYDGNIMESVQFKDVVLTGRMGEQTGIKQENVFTDCDKEGFTFIRKTLGFESLNDSLDGSMDSGKENG